METCEVGIVGYGFVGTALHKLFGNVFEVAIYDKNIDEYNTQEWIDAVNNCKFAFVSVPTQTLPEDGACNTSIVEKVVSKLECEIIIIRSTVEPGTTDKLRESTGKRIIFQPEYVGETVAHPLLDHKMQNFAVLGGPLEDTSPVADLYKRVFHSEIRFHFTDAKTAEVTKYMENSFYAVKVAFCNEFYSIAKAHGIDYNELRETWLADPRISRDHTFVYPDDRGFSGKCLPKDVSAIIASSEKNQFSPQLMRAVMEINAAYRRNDQTYEPYRDIPKASKNIPGPLE